MEVEDEHHEGRVLVGTQVLEEPPVLAKYRRRIRGDLRKLEKDQICLAIRRERVEASELLVSLARADTQVEQRVVRRWEGAIYGVEQVAIKSARTPYKDMLSPTRAMQPGEREMLTTLFDKYVDKTKFIAFLKQLRTRNPFLKCASFVDRLSVHRTIAVRDVASELNIKLIFNASYSPNYNPIEGVIGLAKAHIKQKRWQNLHNNTKWEDK